MVKYVFSKKAVHALDVIYQYTLDNHGKRQANIYMRELHAHLLDLADKRKFWHTLPDSLIVPPDLNIKAYMSKYQKHYIFFRQLSAGKIGIMALYHEKNDIPVRLATDLNKLEQMIK